MSLYTAEWVYNGPDVGDVRCLASPDDCHVNASDADAYVVALAQNLNGSASSHLAWDGTAAIWSDVTVSQTGLVNASGQREVTIIYSGKLLLNSSSLSDLHIFTIQHPASSSINTFHVALSVTNQWWIGTSSGLGVTASSQNFIEGDVNGTLAAIEVWEPRPPGPPGGNDTTPPVVNAGQDRSAPAGELVTFNGSAADANDTDFLRNGSFWWTFSYNGSEVNLTGITVSYTFWARGQYLVAFTANDTSGNRASDTLVLTIVPPDQEAPIASAGSDKTAIAGESVSFQGQATDNDPDFPFNAAYQWAFAYDGSNQSLPGTGFSFIFQIPGTYTLTFAATDAWGNRGTDQLVVTVVPPDQLPPTLSTEPLPTIELGVPATIRGTATDNDPAFPQGAQFRWTFYDNLTFVNRSGPALEYTFERLGAWNLTFTALDYWGNRAEITVHIEVERPDRVPPSVNAGDDATVERGTALALIGEASDNDPEFTQTGHFRWTISRGGVDENVSITGRFANYTFAAAGSYEVTFWATDFWGNTATDTLTATVLPATGPGPGVNNNSAGLGLDQPLLLLGLVGAGAAGALGLVAYRRRLNGGAASAVPGVGPAAGSAKPAYVVEAVLILHRDGRLIQFQASGAEASIESPEVIGSMFTAVTEFIRDSFGKEGALSRLTFGQNTIVLERSKHLFGAVIVYGEADAQLAETLTDVLRRLEVSYAGLVERWTGDREAFEGIAGFVAPLLALTSGLTRADVRAASSDKTVRLGSGTEHYKGYIRLRVAMVNQTESTIKDARVTVLFNQGVLRLARIEPAALKQEGLTVHMGDIQPGERLGASFYLDPQTCSQTNIEGVGTYRDADGDSKTVKMKPRVAEIVCPLFFTPQHANPAMMRRLIETSLSSRDSRLYRVTRLPDGFGYGDLFNTAREAVQRHHVVLVRNIKQKGPFEGTAWLYGQTKHSRSPVIIRVTVSEKRRSAEFFVAVDSPATLTGMLAEFNRSFVEMMNSRAPLVELETVLDDSLKAVMSAEGLEQGGDATAGDDGSVAK